jgi:hypothetical protein
VDFTQIGMLLRPARDFVGLFATSWRHVSLSFRSRCLKCGCSLHLAGACNMTRWSDDHIHCPLARSRPYVCRARRGLAQSLMAATVTSSTITRAAHDACRAL